MVDIIERLKYFSGWSTREVPGIELNSVSTLCWDAIDEIERLRDGLRGAIRIRDLLTADGDPSALLIPVEIDDTNNFTQAFDDLATSLRNMPASVSPMSPAQREAVDK